VVHRDIKLDNILID
jgi:5'-AMP-activated protein kinase, catalytic alpha subunit